MGIGVGTTPGLHSWKTWLQSKASAAGRQSGLAAFSSFQAVQTSSSWASSGSTQELLKKTRASFARTALHTSPLYWLQQPLLSFCGLLKEAMKNVPSHMLFLSIQSAFFFFQFPHASYRNRRKFTSKLVEMLHLNSVFISTCT